MIRVDINDEHVEIRERGDYKFYEQDAWAHFYNREGKLDPHPQKVVIQLQKDQKAWPLGSYQIHPASMYRNRFGQIELGRLVLVPLKEAGLKAA